MRVLEVVDPDLVLRAINVDHFLVDLLLLRGVHALTVAPPKCVSSSCFSSLLRAQNKTHLPLQMPAAAAAAAAAKAIIASSLA